MSLDDVDTRAFAPNFTSLNPRGGPIPDLVSTTFFRFKLVFNS